MKVPFVPVVSAIRDMTMFLLEKRIVYRIPIGSEVPGRVVSCVRKGDIIELTLEHKGDIGIEEGLKNVSIKNTIEESV